jgi:hypothetical protein
MTTELGKFSQKDAPTNAHSDVSPRTDKQVQSPSQGGNRDHNDHNKDMSAQKTMPIPDKKVGEIPATSKL